ncbi:MAG: hypothetical protein J0G29_00865 [Alphaproteobacteria bacterium]|nr:hypothetical protein [Alphaproteobacteria bacterium]OJV47184.1 MAG: hypothetical protein BGO28_01600 [Alphaproteobacteria bacterium 43-37]
MPTKKPRLNITFEESTLTLLSQLAEAENKPISNIAKALIIEALERREDIYFSALAEEREKSNQAPLVSHEDAWK